MKNSNAVRRDGFEQIPCGANIVLREDKTDIESCDNGNYKFHVAVFAFQRFQGLRTRMATALRLPAASGRK